MLCCEPGWFGLRANEADSFDLVGLHLIDSGSDTPGAVSPGTIADLAAPYIRDDMIKLCSSAELRMIPPLRRNDGAILLG